MKKNYLYLALAMSLSGTAAFAQAPCASDDMHKHYKQQFPEISMYEKQMNESIASFIASQGVKGKVASKTTATRSDTDYYDIPVVVHVVHNYGSEFVKDSAIHVMMKQLNDFYNAKNNLTGIITPFKKYIGNAKIRFHLASKDPSGNPSTGITRRYSYLTVGGDDQAKVDQWPPRNYYNIWLENVIGRSIGTGIVLAYATFPSTGESFPYSDGVISRADRIMDGNTIPHETGHYFSLYHPWNSGAGVGEACGDDEVDDTPPTKGHFSQCRNPQELYDTACANNYYKLYTSASGMMDSLVNYPDTTNTQNIMDYSDCPTNMVSIGQVWRMRATLNSNIGGRNNLWDSTNLAATGVLSGPVDLTPVPEFVSRQNVGANGTQAYFTFPGTALFFTNKSWRDTVTSCVWTFSNGASKPTVTSTSYTDLNSPFDVTFSTPGWVNIKMDVTGNNSGTATREFNKSVFVADETAVGSGYIQEFNPDGDRDKWPMFNYYNNNFKWQLANYGVYDNNCVMYQGYDTRAGSELFTNTPRGDFDDLYSVPFDISGFGSGPCYLNFSYSGASRTASAADITDSLFIEYSIDKKHTWFPLTALGKSTLINKGTISTPYYPTSVLDWAPAAVNIPAAARKPYTVFRFRYKPGTFKSTMASTVSTGNNFFLDRIQVTPWAADVATVNMGNIDMKVVPNPTHGDAYVVVKDVNNTKVEVAVTDITGKTVFTTTENISGNTSRIVIPQQAISVKGIYLVSVVTGNQVSTQKLVVY